MLSTVEFSISQAPSSPGEARAEGIEPSPTVLETGMRTVTPRPYVFS